MSKKGQYNRDWVFWNYKHLCDQWMVELSGDKKKYAQYLLDQFRGQKQRYTLALGLNQSSKLEKQIKNILLTENLSD